MTSGGTCSETGTCMGVSVGTWSEAAMLVVDLWDSRGNEDVLLSPPVSIACVSASIDIMSDGRLD